MEALIWTIWRNSDFLLGLLTGLAIWFACDRWL